MTKKDYLRLARAFRDARIPEPNGYHVAQFDRTVDAVTAALKDDNPAFDVAKFREAIYWQESK